MSNKSQDPRLITAETAGKDLLGALVTEIKLLPDVWQKLPKAKQDDVIDRLRKRVDDNIKMVVYTLAAQNRVVVAGNLDQITIKDGVKAVVKFGIHAPNLDGLYEAASDAKAVLVVVADAADYTQGMDEVSGEDDQRNIDLGHEYHDNDGGGMDGVHDVDPESGDVIGLPKFTQEQLEDAYAAGYLAADQGKKQKDCPIMESELVIEWVRGFKAWHEEQEQPDDKDAA